MIFNYKFNIDLKKISSLTNFRKMKVLDFGCGTGVWDNDQVIKFHKLSRITLYDKNKNFIKLLKSKYKNDKVKIDFNLHSILNNKNFNVIVMSSVIQYLKEKELENLINLLSNNKKNVTIIITDVPYMSRICEFLLLPLFNIKRFFFSLKLIISKEYLKNDYNIFNKNYFSKYKKKFNVTLKKNIHDLPFLRYSVILKKKNC